MGAMKTRKPHPSITSILKTKILGRLYTVHLKQPTDLVNDDLQREKQYDHGNLATIIVNSEPLPTAEQENIYDRVMLLLNKVVFSLGRTKWKRSWYLTPVPDAIEGTKDFQYNKALREVLAGPLNDAIIC
ncbi:hypothetical protein EVAR_24094_1 [Eumeta japonica]|uniref:Uncharacterized protein n=1 Tax=Eumeta variegata TaxID=151549 RepID=A0A4C1ZUK9_EUMVA|nr:hypothetical protein EVAR_24094_1 [Eumeta japonica]